MGVSISSSGSFDKTEKFLKGMLKLDIRRIVESLAKTGVEALVANTPRDSGVAASSWGYTITQTFSSTTITWFNTDIENGFPVIIALQYGHGTGTGGYVQGRDFINPAIRPVFDEIDNAVWKAVTSA